MPAPRSEIVLAYRHLHKHLLRAVQYSKPARFVARDRLRRAFRSSAAPEGEGGRHGFDAGRVARTLEFLDAAARVKGLEHRIVKNLMHVWWERGNLSSARMRRNDAALRKVAYDEFDATVEKLNESMGLCIK